MPDTFITAILESAPRLMAKCGEPARRMDLLFELLRSIRYRMASGAAHDLRAETLREQIVDAAALLYLAYLDVTPKDGQP
jgi:hypothetical protein